MECAGMVPEGCAGMVYMESNDAKTTGLISKLSQRLYSGKGKDHF
ncbi:hypothetical protein [Rubritalea tangerina]